VEAVEVYPPGHDLSEAWLPPGGCKSRSRVADAAHMLESSASGGSEEQGPAVGGRERTPPQFRIQKDGALIIVWLKGRE
jgi:hypothetical protein